MFESNSYIDRIINNIQEFMDSKNRDLKHFLGADKLIRNESRKSNSFSSFEYLKSTFKLDDCSWICLLISVLNEIKSRNFDPIQESIKSFNFKNESKRYQQLRDLESRSLSLFLDRNKKIDKYILEFLMTNGSAEISSREFKIFFPSLEKIAREKDAYNFSKICKTSVNNVYFFINGPEGIGKKTFAKRVASICERALVLVDLEKCLNSETDFSKIIISSLRQSMLMNGIVCFDRIDLLKERKRRTEFLLESSKNFCKSSFFLSSTNCKLDFKNLESKVVVIDHSLRNLSVSKVLPIWKEKLKKSKIDNIVDIKEIANTFRITPGQIKNAADLIFSEKIANLNFGKKSIFKSIQKTIQANFGGYAYPISTDNSWDDLIIPYQDKKMIIDICKQRKLKNIVFEDWGLSERIDYGKGLSLLFSGAPGTGKTMVAGIISNEMGLPLYRVDLSKIVSKYIGETEKNLSSLFDKAERSNSILLFDETDALFSQRTEVKDSKDRGANLEISYLLQRMESHSGICIMTTNYLENIDQAFFRRISYVFHFPKPSKKDREKIWRNFFGKKVPTRKIDFDFISKFELSGGSIKNIVVSSCLKAVQEKKKVSMKHIIKSIEYELKKQGYTPLKSDFDEYAYLL